MKSSFKNKKELDAIIELGQFKKEVEGLFIQGFHHAAKKRFEAYRKTNEDTSEKLLEERKSGTKEFIEMKDVLICNKLDFLKKNYHF